MKLANALRRISKISVKYPSSAPGRMRYRALTHMLRIASITGREARQGRRDAEVMTLKTLEVHPQWWKCGDSKRFRGAAKIVADYCRAQGLRCALIVPHDPKSNATLRISW